MAEYTPPPHATPVLSKHLHLQPALHLAGGGATGWPGLRTGTGIGVPPRKSG
eukprot:CAMPEP_0205866464 /NCGR_PEP_ID=MMETSP1083-20121108/8430_1 /ASSEMBLY_ACC=CAM_ASM_000430 /TAXON_ID=97485 /ORGANISM="Prymnesium parvum, Strain Texoma1" /LENGTH=51 /DNA_ID=CAMNT_0053228463 /DNA_START=289 /DNA_END=441 /DNA_ORIENTATION=+